MTKICLHCQEPIIQRDNENNYRYQRRKFCSQVCYNKYMRANKKGWYAHFPNPPQGPIGEVHPPKTTIS